MKIKKSIASVAALALALTSMSTTAISAFAVDDTAKTAAVTTAAPVEVNYSNAKTVAYDLTTPYNGYVTKLKTQDFSESAEEELNWVLTGKELSVGFAATEDTEYSDGTSANKGGEYTDGRYDPRLGTLIDLKRYMNLTVREEKQIDVFYDIQEVVIKVQTGKGNVTTYHKSSDVKSEYYDYDFEKAYSNLTLAEADSLASEFTVSLDEFDSAFTKADNGGYKCTNISVEMSIAAKTLTAMDSKDVKTYTSDMKRRLQNTEIKIDGAAQGATGTTANAAAAQAKAETAKTSLWNAYKASGAATPEAYATKLAEDFKVDVVAFNAKVMAGDLNGEDENAARLKAAEELGNYDYAVDAASITVEKFEVTDTTDVVVNDYVDADYDAIATALEGITFDADNIKVYQDADGKWGFSKGTAVTKKLTDLNGAAANAATDITEADAKACVKAYVADVLTGVNLTAADLAKVQDAVVANYLTWTSGSAVAVNFATANFTADAAKREIKIGNTVVVSDTKDTAATTSKRTVYRPKTLAASEQKMFLEALGLKDIQQDAVKANDGKKYTKYYDSTSNYVTKTDDVITKLKTLQAIVEEEAKAENAKEKTVTLTLSQGTIAEPQEIYAKEWYGFQGAYDWRNSSYYLAEVVDVIGESKGAIVTFHVEPNSLKKNDTKAGTVGSYDADKYFTKAAGSIVLRVNGSSTNSFTNLVSYNPVDSTISFKWDDITGAHFTDNVLYVRTLDMLSSLNFDIDAVQVTIPDQTQFVVVDEKPADTTGDKDKDDKDTSDKDKNDTVTEIEAGEKEDNDNILITDDEDEDTDIDLGGDDKVEDKDDKDDKNDKDDDNTSNIIDSVVGGDDKDNSNTVVDVTPDNTVKPESGTPATGNKMGLLSIPSILAGVAVFAKKRIGK